MLPENAITHTVTVSRRGRCQIGSRTVRRPMPPRSAKSIPPLMNVMQEVGGVKMPDYFGKLASETVDAKPAAVSETPAKS